jgi:4-hydroxy-4-methyl-2-oxoglutarate aldolase
MNTSIVYTNIPACDPQLIKEADRYSVADLHESIPDQYRYALLMNPAMKPVCQGTKIVGQAVTAENTAGDNIFIYTAMKVCKPGQVLVMTNGGYPFGALWGDVATTFAQKFGIAGVVIDGPARDVDAIRDMQFPVWSTAVSASHSEKRGPGSTNLPINVAGVRVNPGDVIVADGDGVVVIPLNLLEVTLANAKERYEKELVFRDKLLAGEHICDVTGANAMIDKVGIEIREGTWQDTQ